MARCMAEMLDVQYEMLAELRRIRRGQAETSDEEDDDESEGESEDETMR